MSGTHQRAGLATLIGGILMLCAWRLYSNPRQLPDPSAQSDRLVSQIDPNTADTATLAVLPMLGKKRAEEIVAFRTREKQRHPTTTVFEQPEDLTRVSGIGASTVSNLKPYLIFPTTRPDEPQMNTGKHR